MKIDNVGPIKRADITFGDLTVLVGPQATGKSILLQFLKLVVDSGYVLAELKRYGLRWDREFLRFLDIYLGEGMQGVWNGGPSELRVNGSAVDMENLVQRQKRDQAEQLFYVPAQRVLTLGRGWPRPFADYSPGDPFVVRDYSEKMRVLLESDLDRFGLLFPQSRRIKGEVRTLLDKAIFNRLQLHVDKRSPQKRLVLRGVNVGNGLPFMVWSAGQREFIPLLLAFYWLLPPSKAKRRGDIRWVVVEEIEMGLHPNAISVTLLLVLDLLARGYRVCLSTHSPHVLDVVWGLQSLRQYGASPKEVIKMFDVKASPALVETAKKSLHKTSKVYYFDPASGETKDISELDPGAENQQESGWGGLTEFSGRVADVVAGVVSNGSGG